MDIGKQLGKRLTVVRKKKGMTAEKLAYENGISKGYLSDIESGKKVPTVKMLARLAAALGVPVRDLFDF